VQRSELTHCNSLPRNAYGRRNTRLVGLIATVCVAIGFTLAAAESKKPTNSKDVSKQALSEFNSLIGGWRGVGLPKRGSRTGAWIEKAEWVWDFDKNHVGIRYSIDKGKLLKTALLTYEPKSKNYRLRGQFSGKVERDYSGQMAGKKLVLESKPGDDGYVHRISVTRLNEKRTLVLFEKRRTQQNFYSRVAEIGYTRAGTSLAFEGAGEPECVVTGGKGTSKVSYKGKTYYVCCTGCRQAFDADPEGVLTDYRKKKAKEAAERKAKS
jgi:YHS domain-containing protein